MTDPTARVELEEILDTDLPAVRQLSPENRSHLTGLLQTALTRERAFARDDLAEKLANRPAAMRYVMTKFVLGRRR